MAKQSPEFTIPPTGPRRHVLPAPTSGTTGMPRSHTRAQCRDGSLHEDQYALDSIQTISSGVQQIRDGDGHFLWHYRPCCAASPTSIDEAEFDADAGTLFCKIKKVRSGNCGHTAIRRLMRLDIKTAWKFYDLSNLRFSASVGEPLNPGSGGVGAMRCSSS